MTIETLVTIHDQTLVDSCEAEERFEYAKPYRYLFVGPRDVGLFRGFTNDADGNLRSEPERVILARVFEPNKEHLPQFYDFTGWWTATHHGLIDFDRVVCLQYDHRVNAPIMPIVDSFLDAHPMGAFVAGHRAAGNFMLHIGGFEDAYRAGLDRIGAPSLDVWPDFNEWPSTQGTAWRTDALTEFMEWVTPLFDFWADNMWAGHLMERMPKAWLVATGQTEAYLPALVTHEGRDCHGTCSLMAGRTDVYAERAANFGR